MRKLGLLGRNIGYSFSRNYFAQKFKTEGLTHRFSYENFDLASTADFPEILKKNPELIGLNVTIPYKEEIIPFLDELSSSAEEIGAVNTIKILGNGTLCGYNTDYYGFITSLQPLLQPQHKKALLLGTGGAAKAVAYGLAQLGIQTLYVSRKKHDNSITYNELTAEILSSHQILVNCTPLGTFPDTNVFPEIPFEFLTTDHVVYDLIYNPEKTTFLAKAEAQGATIKNGYEMLVLQAEKAWELWNS